MLTHAPIFRNSVTMPDTALAHEALRLMGAPEAGGSGSCHDCHGVTRESIRHFRALSDAAWSSCFADLTVATPAIAGRTLLCFRVGGNYSASRMGVFASGGYFDWFRYVFQQAVGAGWEDDYAAFTDRVAMPPAGHTAFTQAEFDIVTEWFLRGTPLVDTILPPTDAPGSCTPHIDPEVMGVIADGATTGWSSRNRSAGVLMHGCVGAATAMDCLSSSPLASSLPGGIGTGWAVAPGTHARVVFEANYSTSYWTRSSADGRFVAHGGSPGVGRAAFIDLQRGVVIEADAAYDPGFFPDNSGFIFQGTSAGGSICRQSVLTTGAPTHITFGEVGCGGAGSVGLYQHVGASLDGSDYWAVNSSWSGDAGGSPVDPGLFVDATSQVTFIAMLNSGSGFVESGTTTVTTPWEGNAVISPTARLLVTEIGNSSGTPIGYVLHRIAVTRDPGGARTVTLPEVARYCVQGGKPAFSLDDHWLVTHHRAVDADAVELGFTGSADPLFAAYRGTSNIYLMDLGTGVRTRLTHVAAGQEALFPHFRSDGWIYFIVRTGSLPEYVVATDAALVLGS